MAFRANEAAIDGFERAKAYLISREIAQSDRHAGEEKLREITTKYGAVVDSYPSWHPLVCNHDNQQPETRPSIRSGYKGLDHTLLFAHAFITCPYGDGQDVIDAVENLPEHPVATIQAERLETSFYSASATAILVYCEWSEPLGPEKLIPTKVAVPLMLEQELPCWRDAQRAETWETMRPYIMGEPFGSRSSLFVDQTTALALKKIYVAMVGSGMYGPKKRA